MITLQATCRDFFQRAMGLCLSCCPLSSDSDSVNPDGDRAGLLNNENVPRGNSNIWNSQASDDEPLEFPNGSLAESYGQLGNENAQQHLKLYFITYFFYKLSFSGSGIHFPSSLPKPKKNDEQAALNNIVHRLAGDIIDVNMAHATQTLEAAELQERAHEYGRRLHADSSRLAQKWAHLKKAKSDGLVDSGANAEKLIHSEILNPSDTLLINEVAARAREALTEFQVQPVPNLVGQFGQIRRQIEIENESPNDNGEAKSADDDEGSSPPNETTEDEEEE